MQQAYQITRKTQSNARERPRNSKPEATTIRPCSQKMDKLDCGKGASAGPYTLARLPWRCRSEDSSVLRRLVETVGKTNKHRHKVGTLNPSISVDLALSQIVARAAMSAVFERLRTASNMSRYLLIEQQFELTPSPQKGLRPSVCPLTNTQRRLTLLRTDDELKISTMNDVLN